MFRTPAGGPSGLADESTLAIGKSIPGVTASGLVVAGVPLESWVVILTATFLVLQIAYIVYKFARDLRRDGNDQNG